MYLWDVWNFKMIQKQTTDWGRINDVWKNKRKLLWLLMWILCLIFSILICPELSIKSRHLDMFCPVPVPVPILVLFLSCLCCPLLLSVPILWCPSMYFPFLPILFIPFLFRPISLCVVLTRFGIAPDAMTTLVICCVCFVLDRWVSQCPIIVLVHNGPGHSIMSCPVSSRPILCWSMCHVSLPCPVQSCCFLPPFHPLPVCLVRPHPVLCCAAPSCSVLSSYIPSCPVLLGLAMSWYACLCWIIAFVSGLSYIWIHLFFFSRIVRNKLGDKRPEDHEHGLVTSGSPPSTLIPINGEGDRTGSSYSISGILGIPKDKRGEKLYPGKILYFFSSSWWCLVIYKH